MEAYANMLYRFADSVTIDDEFIDFEDNLFDNDE
jgi:hypothetical protein